MISRVGEPFSSRCTRPSSEPWRLKAARSRQHPLLKVVSSKTPTPIGLSLPGERLPCAAFASTCHGQTWGSFTWGLEGFQLAQGRYEQRHHGGGQSSHGQGFGGCLRAKGSAPPLCRESAARCSQTAWRFISPAVQYTMRTPANRENITLPKTFAATFMAARKTFWEPWMCPVYKAKGGPEQLQRP